MLPDDEAAAAAEVKAEVDMTPWLLRSADGVMVPEVPGRVVGDDDPIALDRGEGDMVFAVLRAATGLRAAKPGRDSEVVLLALETDFSPDPYTREGVSRAEIGVAALGVLGFVGIVSDIALLLTVVSAFLIGERGEGVWCFAGVTTGEEARRVLGERKGLVRRTKGDARTARGSGEGEGGWDCRRLSVS